MNNPFYIRHKKLLLSGLVSVGIIGFLLNSLDIQVIKNNMVKLNLLHLSVIIICNILILYIYALRWAILINIQLSELNVSLKKYMLSNIFNFFTPSNIGGDIYKIKTFTSTERDAVKISVAVFYERVISLVLFGFVLVTILAIDNMQQGLLSAIFRLEKLEANMVSLFAIACVFMIMVLLFVLSRFEKFKKLTQSIFQHLKSIFIEVVLSSKIFLVAVLTIGAIVFWALTFQSIAQELGLEIPAYCWVLICIFSEISRFLPISLQGIGVREATFVFIGSIISDQPELFFIVGTIGYICYTIAVSVSPLTYYIHILFEKRG